MACLWGCVPVRPDSALGTLADLTLRLPSVWSSPGELTPKPATTRLDGGGGPRPIELWSPKLSASEEGSTGGKEI